MKRLEDSELSTAPSKVLDILCKLGKGSYGSVFKARHKRTGSIVAVKKVPVDSDLSEIVKEISIMQQCDSPYIVKCHGSLFDNQDLWICMEYCGAGSVADIMRLRNQTLREEEIGTILKYSLLGLDYLHQMRKIHRDIKAGNILLTNSGMAKLADFGVAGQLADTLAKRNTVIGTPYWMAPEVIQEVGYNCSADIWSLGITAIEMGDGKPPLGEEHPMRALFMIPSQPPPHLRKTDSWSSGFVSLVNSCLAKVPEARPSAADLLATEFIQNSKPCSILVSLIEESNAAREKRLAESKAAGTRCTGSSQRSLSQVVDVVHSAGDSPDMANGNANSSTMVQRSEKNGSNNGKCSAHWEQNTLISIGSDDRSVCSVGGVAVHRSRAGRHVNSGTDLSDSQGGTMVINDDDGDEDFGGSVLVYDSLSGNVDQLAEQLARQMPSNSASSPGNDNADTLTRQFSRTAAANHGSWSDQAPAVMGVEDTAAAVAAAQRDCGVFGVPQPAVPHPVAQRPFAPFSRAFQESGILDNVGNPPDVNNKSSSSNALALANEPGGLAKLSYSELEQLLVNLGRDLETELRNLAVRYRHKRQPLLDAIAEKTAMADVQGASPSPLLSP